VETYYYVVDPEENKFIFLCEKGMHFFVCSTDEFIKKPEDMQPIINRISDISSGAIKSLVVHSAPASFITEIAHTKNLIVRVVKPSGKRNWAFLKDL